MRNLAYILAAASILWAIGIGASYALGVCPDCGHGAPAPEIGASGFGMLLAGGLAWYVRKRRDNKPQS
jgi:hypothetical protein